MLMRHRRRGLIALAVIAIILIPVFTSFAENIKYIYDDLKRLEKMIFDNGTVIEYVYDEIGNRDQKAIYKVPIISVIPSSYDYGSVNAGSSSDKIFTVQNPGNLDLEIYSVTSPLSPYSLTESCSGLTLALYETCSITVSFQPPLSDGALLTGSFNIESNDPNYSSVTVNLSGTTPDLKPPTG